MDNFIVSARKYRPATFDMVVGQTAITSTLKNAIRNNILAQAFLFTGPRGVGKTTCARIMAKTINCLNPTPEMEACDECESCVSFRNSASFNIHELDAASNNSVDDIRNLVDQVRIPPQVGKYKIYIIDEVHMLSPAAFNAFLKTLEEPPAYAKFILATTEKHKIIPTILSRCQIFDFKRITLDDIVKHLQYVASKEGVIAESDALNIIAQKADGALRDALSIFDQMVSFSGNSISYKDVIDNLNVLDYEYYFKVTEAIQNGNSSATLLLLNEIIDNGFDGQHFITGLGKHFRDLLVSKDVATIQLMEVSQSLRERYAVQAMQCTSDFLLKVLVIGNQCDINYARSSNKRLLIEISLLQMCGIMQQNNPADLVSPSVIAKPSGAISHHMPQITPQPKTSSQIPSKPNSGSNQPINPSVNPEKSYQVTPDQPTLPLVRESGKAKPKSLHTLSISETEQSEVKVEENELVLDTPFSNDLLRESWKAFADSYKQTSPSFAMALLRYEPEIGPDHSIVFEVDNNIVIGDKLNMNALTEFLKTTLKNNQIKLSHKLVEKPAKNEAFTDREKFEKMATHRPMLQLFKDELGLEAEI
ncbi:MAG: DNA polymerase III subunit gamma/tau [Bacteroidetes bacterium HGW-Bacteroidetes-1]|jgi:DNA polymerase-3 subunit gamma/tau|nr:MAG: DNA polymerase III subunit gamma/tau [Bacteroidetes bacterium HGW-Bacteroidetes-1]